MRSSSHCFVTNEPGRGRRLNLVWHPLKGKAGIVADSVSGTHSVQKIADTDMCLVGTAITSATSSARVEGGILYANVAGTVNEVLISPLTIATQTNLSPWSEFTWPTDKEIEWECLLEMTAVAADGAFMKNGMTLDPADTAVGNQVDELIFGATDNLSLDLEISVNSTDTIVSDVALPRAAQLVHLAMKWDRNQGAHAYVDGREVPCSASWAGNVASLIPTVGMREDTGADVNVNCLGMAISKIIA